MPRAQAQVIPHRTEQIEITKPEGLIRIWGPFEDVGCSIKAGNLYGIERQRGTRQKFEMMACSKNESLMNGRVDQLNRVE